MRRALIAAIAAGSLFAGTATASASILPIGNLFGSGGSLLTSLLPSGFNLLPTGSGLFPVSQLTELLSPKAAVRGTVVSTDPADGTFVADASVVNPFDFIGGLGLGFGSSTPSTTQVTISTDSNTMMLVNGAPGSVSNLTAGDHFIGLFNGWPMDSIQSLTSSPAAFIFDHSAPTPRHVYGFVGSVTGVDTTAGTVSVNVSDTIPSDLAPTGSSASFTVGQQTLLIGGTAGGSLIGGLGGSLSDVSVGDIVAGALIAPAGDTLSQVETLPLNVLLDLPAPSTSSAAAHVKARALREAMALLGGKVSKHHRRHHHRHHHQRH